MKGLKNITIIVLFLCSSALVGAEEKSNLEVLDIRIEPIRLGKNVVHVKVQNTSDKVQTFGIDIRAEGATRNWQRQFFETVKNSETKWLRFEFEIFGPITNSTSIRLQFYNPASRDEYHFDNWFKRIRYSAEDLEMAEGIQAGSAPASKNQSEAVIKAFKKFQKHLKSEKYEAAWELFAGNLRSQYQDDFEGWREQVISSDEVKTLFLNLHPESVSKNGDILTLTARYEDALWKIHFIKEDERWKIYDAQDGRSNWQERLLPKMAKRATKHFDIYYFEDSTAAKEIDVIAEQKEKGFRKICQFLGKGSDIRICMVFFEDGETKKRETGHQGAGWAFGHTIVEIYNEEEKLDPYHETVHILMDSYGNPPALFNEGFATYMSERLGAHGLESLGGGQSSIYERVRELKNKGELISLEELITYTEIGSAKTQPPVAYPEAASFVKFLIDNYGKDKFLQAYKKLRNSGDKAIQQQNVKTLEIICHKSLTELKTEWESTFLTLW